VAAVSVSCSGDKTDKEESGHSLHVLGACLHKAIAVIQGQMLAVGLAVACDKGSNP